MKRMRLGAILALVCLAPGATLARNGQSAAETIYSKAQAERFSPHYYTVRNIIRNHRVLTPAGGGPGNSLMGGSSIPISEVEIDSDVIFQGGSYEFHARIQDAVSKVRLRKRDSRWILDIVDDFSDRVLATYVLEH